MAFEKINEFAADKQKLCVEHDTISDELFREYGVNRGLRDINGKGVLTGLTRISKVVSFKDENGEHVPCDGELWYRGYNINTLIKNLDGFGFEKTAYLLIFGEMPTAQQLAEFNDVLTECRTLPSNASPASSFERYARTASLSCGSVTWVRISCIICITLRFAPP